MPRLVDSGGRLVLLPEAPPRVPDDERGPLLITQPDGRTVTMSFKDATELHLRLGQELARGMRRREPSQ